MNAATRFSIALLVAGAVVGACADPSHPVRVLSVDQAPTPGFARVRASDSTLTMTNTAYSDTALVLKRLTPLAADVSVSAVIGPAGGEIKINEAGGKIDFPAGALTSPTLITMTAYKGYDVAYDFQPHGITFNVPVKIQQSIAGTWAQQYPQLLNGIHGSYFSGSLSDSWVDPGHYFAHIAENELGYVDTNASQVKFYIGHFSGYMMSCGRE